MFCLAVLGRAALNMIILLILYFVNGEIQSTAVVPLDAVGVCHATRRVLWVGGPERANGARNVLQAFSPYAHAITRDAP
jgi:hypothetical protein